MKYKFICSLQNIKVDKTMNRGKVIKDNLRISNSNSKFLQLFGNEDFKKAIGSIEYDSFENSHFIYCTGEDENLTIDNHMEKINKILVDIQLFVSSIWILKDNSVNFKQGYMQLYDGDIYKCTSSNGRAVHFLNAGCEIETINMSEEEIDEVIEYATSFKIEQNMESYKEKIFLAYNYELKRIEKFLYTLQMARNQNNVLLRLSVYSMLAEILISTNKSSSTQQISTRIAILLESEYDKRMELMKFIKEMYSVRSSIFHGDKLNNTLINKNNYTDFLEHSKKFDYILRKLLLSILNNSELLLSINDNSEEGKRKIDEYFNRKLFS